MRLLRSRSFALLFVGSALNAIGSWGALVAMWGFASYRFHAGAGSIALIGLAWAVPSALLAPLAGVPIDRLGPRRVILAAYVLGSATSVAMALAGTLRTLILLGLVHGLSEAFARPANDALPPRLVEDEDLLAANALLGSASQSAIVFGPLVAAVAIALFGLRGAFVVDAATFWAAIAVMVPLRLCPVTGFVPVGQAEKPRLRDDLAEGWEVARTSPVVRFTLLLSVAVFLTWGTFLVIEPLYVRDVLHRSSTVFAMLQMVFGVGLVSAGLTLPRFANSAADPRVLAASVLLSGVAAAAYIGTRWLAVAFIGVFLWGVDVAFFVTPARTLLQRGSPMRTHGRILGLFNSLQSWANVLALPLAATVASAWGPRAAGLAIAGVAVAAGTGGLLVHPRVLAGPGDTPASPDQAGDAPEHGSALEALAALATAGAGEPLPH